MPVIGFLRSTPGPPFTKLVDTFRQGWPSSASSRGPTSSSSIAMLIITWSGCPDSPPIWSAAFKAFVGQMTFC